MDSFQEDLVRTAQWFSSRLSAHPLIGSMLDATVSEIDLAVFLRDSAFYVSWTPALLQRAASALDEQRRFPGLATRLLAKSKEETGHDLWALQDLAELGVSLEALRLRPPSPSVRAYVAWNLSLVRTAPYAFAATAFLLEYASASCGGAVVDALRRRGPPFSEALRYLEGHAAADPLHAEDILSAMNEIRDPEAQRETLDAARTVAQLFLHFW